MEIPDHVRIAIVGSGFAGLGMAIKLKEAGEEDFILFERRDDVGGTWNANTYPGAACDVPSRLYSFSFAGYDWSRSFSEQGEIQDYLRTCVDRFGVRPRLRFGVKVEEAAWDDDAGHWHVRTTSGDLTADVLVSAGGALSEPKLPDIPGVESFAGKIFHSAAWDHEHDVSGERVAVVGTGASAIQIVPAIQPKVGHLDLYQRTPAWVIPRTDRAFTRVERKLYSRFPMLDKVARTTIFYARESYVLGFTKLQKLMKVPEAIARTQMKRQIPDPDLREKLTPDYQIGCKRILISSEYYPALAQDNADVVTSGIAEIRPHAMVTEDGEERPVDTIVFATGFQVTPPPIAEKIRGRGGALLADRWAEGGMRAHRGTTVPGFPNLFFLVGPNTGLGHNSMVHQIESQIGYVREALALMERERIGEVEVRADAMERFNDRVQRELEGTVWDAGGCASWYLDDHGRNTTLWPGFTFAFRRLLKRFDRESYELRPARTGAPEPVPAAA
jgi:cation diffusion facilitator CzcD-associated flavoprotein CzcO